MRRWVRSVGLTAAGASMAVLGVAGCGGRPAEPGGLIRIANTGIADFDDIPALDGHAMLEAQGYRIERSEYRLSALAAEALARGDADIGIGAVTTYLAAAAKGAPIRLVGEHVANPHRLVGRSGSSCRSLDGASLAVQSPGAASAVFAEAWLDAECPDSEARLAFIQQSDNRLAALLSGHVAAAVLKVGEIVRLERLAPGRFTVLADFSMSWPDLVVVGVFANERWAATHPGDLAAYLQATRAAADGVRRVDALAARALAILGPSDDWEDVARKYIDAEAWWRGGGLSRTRVEATLGFFGTHVDLTALSPETITHGPLPPRDR